MFIYYFKSCHRYFLSASSDFTVVVLNTDVVNQPWLGPLSIRYARKANPIVKDAQNHHLSSNMHGTLQLLLAKLPRRGSPASARSESNFSASCSNHNYAGPSFVSAIGIFNMQTDTDTPPKHLKKFHVNYPYKIITNYFQDKHL